MREFQCGKTHVYELMDQGVLPQSYPIGKRARAWDRDELDIAHERIRAGLAFVNRTGRAVDPNEGDKTSKKPTRGHLPGSLTQSQPLTWRHPREES